MSWKRAHTAHFGGQVPTLPGAAAAWASESSEWSFVRARRLLFIARDPWPAEFTVNIAVRTARTVVQTGASMTSQGSLCDVTSQ